jgi:predicted LPLAT superfamily acyltransferase
MNPRSANLLERSAKAAEWVRHRERGSLWLLKIMAFLSLRCGRGASRIILYCIAGYFFLFGPSARRHSLQYLRLALGRAPAARDRFLQILSFATTIHDRVYLINGQFEKFNVSVEGEEIVLAHEPAGRGALLLGAHMGSFEVVHSLSR